MRRLPLGFPLLLLLLSACLLLPMSAGAQTAEPSGTPVSPGVFDSQSPLEPPTLAATPTATVTETPTPSPTPTWTPEPTATSTPTVAPYQVSPLVAQTTGRPPDDGSALWLGAAALIVLGGSAVLLLAERRG